MDIDYASIEPLITQRMVKGRQVHVTFARPQGGPSVSTSASLRKDNTAGQRIKDSVKRSFMYEARNMLMRALGGLFGGGVAGRVARQATHEVQRSVAAKLEYSEADVQRAIVEAFKRVQGKFARDPQTKTWGAAGKVAQSQSAYDKLLASHPIAEGWDRMVLARVLVEVARADGSMQAGEQQLLGQILPGTDLRELAAKPPLSAAELQGTSELAREAIALLAFSLALADEQLSAAETQRLNAIAGGLGLSASRADALRKLAAAQVLERVFERVWADGKRSPEETTALQAVAQACGISPDELARQEVDFRKQHGKF